MSAGRSSRRAWGWHPLNRQWAARVVQDARIQPGELVFDLGAGDGALTRPLLAAGARVIALELHRRRAASLRSIAHDQLSVVEADASELRLPDRPFRVVASPPYSISSAVVRRLLSRGTRLRQADLVVQRQFATRLLDGQISGLREARRFDGHITRPLPRSAFSPPPKVDSVVLRLQRRR